MIVVKVLVIVMAIANSDSTASAANLAGPQNNNAIIPHGRSYELLKQETSRKYERVALWGPRMLVKSFSFALPVLMPAGL